MADIELEFGVLNIKASPHPDGIYPKLLTRVSDTPRLFRGRDFFALKPPKRVEGGFYRGEILIWTEVDPDAPALDKKKLEAIDFDTAHPAFDTNVGINLRVFLYVLRERDHLIFFESRNDTGHQLNPYRLQKILQQLFWKTNDRGSMQVDIDVLPEEDALAKILAIHRITTLEIHLKKPNADDNTPDAAQVMREMEEQNASQKHIKYTTKTKKGIKPNARTKVEAETAADNGHVRAIGKDKHGEKVDLSTEEYPKIIHYPLVELASAAVAILRIAKDTIIRRRKSDGPSA